MFRAEEIDLLCDPRRWRVVSTLCGSEAPPARDAEHRRWSLRHTHAHPHRELMVALEGSAPYGHTLGIMRCAPGTLMQFEPMEPHDNGYPPWTHGVRHLWLGIGGGFAMARVRVPDGGDHLKGPPGVALHGDDLGFDPRGALQHAAALAPTDPRLARLDLLTVVQGILARAIEVGARAPTEATHSARAIDAVRQHVRETAGAGVTLDGLARLAGYSRFHLVRLFRARTGMGLREWMDRCRLDRLRVLRRDGVPLAQAAAVLGFSSDSALSRWCRKHGLRWRHAGTARDAAM
jgi:AraC-like DNA-binding protein